MVTMTQRFRKQVTIAAITLGIVAVASLSVFLIRQAGSEGDHVLIRYASQDGTSDAQGISALTASEQYLLGEGDNRYVVAVVNNPNESWHASRVSYQFILKGPDAQEKVVEGSSFVGAGSERLLVESLPDDFAAESFSFTIESVDWVSAPERELAMLRVRQAVFETNDQDGERVSRATGRVVNDSQVGAVDVEVGIVARAADGVAVGAGIVQVASLGPGANEELSFSWKGGLANIATLSFFPIAEGISRP